MKPQETELVSEISKLQSMVSELKTGFSSALMELSQIQLGDTFLREELEENRKSCHKKAQRLETLVEALKEELCVVRCQILQLYSNRPRPQPEPKSSKPRESSDPSEPLRTQCQCSSAPGLSRGKLLLHCFLQGLKAGLSEGTDARHQVSMQLLHSEWEYVSTLNQLYDKYKTPPAHHTTLEPYQTYLKFVEQLLQRHLLFRNTLQERLSAEHWKSLVGDILVQLIGQNDTSFSDMYLGYTKTLASFLSLEFNRLNQTEQSHKVKQSGQMEREEMKLLSLLLAPVSRIHSYLGHIQSLLQWTGKDHPDCSLLLGSERALRTILSRCHQILEQDVRWEEEEKAGASSCPETGACGGPSVNCCPGTLQSQQENKTQREDSTGCFSNGLDPPPSLRVECLSCSPVRRKGAVLHEPSRECAHCCLLTPNPPCWGETSDSGQGTYSHHTTRGTNDEGPHTELHDGDTDDTFDYSSVTSCSPDGTLRRDGDSPSGEEDSQVPVLLKPRERTVCLRWQIPRLTPHPPLRNPTAGSSDGTAPGPLNVHNKRLVSVRRGSPPLHPKSAFRPIWDDPTKQTDSAPERDNRQGFIPIQALTRQSFHVFNTHRENLRQSLLQQRGVHAAVSNSGGLWDDSEDSEGPCSTV